MLAAPAGACSVALSNPRATGAQNEIVRRLFRAWWDRNAPAFRSILSGTLPDTATPAERNLARELLEMQPVPPESLAIFDRYFARPDMLKTLHLMVNTAGGVLVGCSEARADGVMESDCSGMPEFHLFLVAMLGSERPGLITHISTVNSAEPGKASIWMEGSG